MPEELYLEPIVGEIDLGKTKEYLMRFPYSFQDTIDPQVYLLCGTQTAAAGSQG